MNGVPFPRPAALGGVNGTSRSGGLRAIGGRRRAIRPADGATFLEDRISDHLGGSARTLEGLQSHAPLLARWAQHLAVRLTDGGRLLVAGNGGSAAEAQHLTAELVGRYDGERRPFSAIALHGDTSAVTAIGNDYGYEQVFARQVRAHARPGDIVLLLSTSGASQNLLCAAEAARECGAVSWALTGPAPNPLESAVDEALTLEGPGCHVQESQLVAIHALCTCFDALIRATEAPAGRDAPLGIDQPSVIDQPPVIDQPSVKGGRP
jgi:phosphoheptose isomerase